MTFLKNKAAWKRWVKNEDIQSAEEPKEFPCVGYEYVADWGMEWTGANYLYWADLIGLLQKFFPAAK